MFTSVSLVSSSSSIFLQTYDHVTCFFLGMMIESMAGKSAALHGTTYDATPFKFSEDYTAISFFGETLRKGIIFVNCVALLLSVVTLSF